MSEQQGTARRLADATLAAVVVVMVGMMIIPLPTGLLDILIAANISVAVLMLLVSMYISGGLEFTAFPTVLLMTTLYRLALNVSSTRLILLQADAGDVIDAFGNFVVQGNYVVGAVVFLILTLIQFLVIAKGSERVAEVGARFTLDAMPGKQMSIDAELRSGGISQEEAREKRDLLQRESQFYGAMDGAMKFVKGDAIAGIVITVINILGGLAIGIAMRDMSAGEALKTYGLLTIGDGLVSQIPALLISTAAGLVVTRVASEKKDGSLGSDVASQIFGNPRALSIGAIFLLGLAIVPGLPALPFLVLAGLFGIVAYRLRSADAAVVTDPRADTAGGVHSPQDAEARKKLVPLVVPVALDIGETLADQIHAPTGSLVDDEVARVRDRLFVDLGVGLPGVRVRRSAALEPQSFAVSVQEVPVNGATVPQGAIVALAPAARLQQLGLAHQAATDPVLGEVAWVAESAQSHLSAANIDSLDPTELVGRYLLRAAQTRASELIGLQEVQTMLDQLERAYPALVRNVIPKPVSLPMLADVLRRLADEGISIRPLREILEALAMYAPNERDPVSLTELVRASLRRQITHRHARQGVLPVHMLDPAIEEAIRDAIQRTATGSFLALQPDIAKDVIAKIRAGTDRAERPPLLLTQADVRRFVRRLIEVEVPDAVVLSYQELSPEITLQPVGRIDL